MAAPVARDNDLTVLLSLAAAISVGYALQLTNGHFDVTGMQYLTGAWVAAAVAVGARLDFKHKILGEPPAVIILAAGLLLQLYLVGRSQPTNQMPGLRSGEDMLPFLLGILIAGVMVGGGLARAGFLKALWFPVIVAVHFWMGLKLLHLAPNPTIDVFVIEKDSLSALLHGVDPYAITFPDPYGGSSPFFPPGVSVNGRLMFGFPYPPLALLLCVPGYLLGGGDPRYSQLAAMAVAALLMGYARPGNLGKIAAAVFLFTPRTFFVLDQAWTDPFVVLLLALVVFVACRVPKYLFVALGLFFCLKQHMFIGVPAVLLLMPRPIVWRDFGRLMLKAFGVAMVVTLPFVLWDVGAFANSVLNIREVFRMDALSILVYLAHQGTVLSKWSGLVAIVPAIALVVWRAPRTPAGFAAGTAIIHFTLYQFSTHAFCNEYYNVLGALCCAAAAALPAGTVEPVAPPVPVPTTPAV